jgi:signal recognition particle receptor subunit alpha
MSEQDLAPALEAMKAQLMAKNVAAEIADDICRSVQASLVGQRQASFTRCDSPLFVTLFFM